MPSVAKTDVLHVLGNKFGARKRSYGLLYACLIITINFFVISFLYLYTENWSLFILFAMHILCIYFLFKCHGHYEIINIMFAPKRISLLRKDVVNMREESNAIRQQNRALKSPPDTQEPSDMQGEQNGSVKSAVKSSDDRRAWIPKIKEWIRGLLFPLLGGILGFFFLSVCVSEVVETIRKYVDPRTGALNGGLLP